MQPDSYYTVKVPPSAPETARLSTFNEDLHNMNVNQMQSVRANDSRRHISLNMPLAETKSLFGQDHFGNDIRMSYPKKWMIQA